MGLYGLIWSRIGISGGLLWTQWWTFRFHKMIGSSWVAAQLEASQEGLSSMSEWVSVQSWDNYVGTATDSAVEVRSPVNVRNFYLLHSTQLSMQLVPFALSPRLKRPGGEAHHSPPSSAEIKKGGAMPPLHHTSFIKHRDNFTFFSFMSIYKSCVITNTNLLHGQTASCLYVTFMSAFLRFLRYCFQVHLSS
jgi:hypothetical protein